jgi:heavy metal sensor kinase
VKIRRPTTLRGRLTLWYTGVLTAMLLLLGSISVVLLDRTLKNNVDDSLKSIAHAMAESVKRPSLYGSDIEESLRSLLGPGLADRFFQLLNPFGELDPRIAPPQRPRLPLSEVALRNAEVGRSTLETVAIPPESQRSFRLLTFPVVRNGSIVNIGQVAMSLENVETARSSFLLVLFALTPVALAGAGLGGWFLARRALTPVAAMVEAARKIEAEDLSSRIPARLGDDELEQLAAVLNDMLARLERSFEAAKRFSADAAHELRTPLTILKGEIEVALTSSAAPAEISQTLESCLEEVNRLNSLVEDLLLMARMESQALDMPPEPVNLADVIRDVAPALHELAKRAGNHCQFRVPPSLWLGGYETLLFRLVFNLAENAIKYTPVHGTIEILLKEASGHAVLEVSDNGPGITPETQEHIFDRFYRGDPAREGGGAGLGLALVQSIVQLHRGRIEVRSEPGKGTLFRVTLPRALEGERPRRIKKF